MAGRGRRRPAGRGGGPTSGVWSLGDIKKRNGGEATMRLYAAAKRKNVGLAQRLEH